MAAPTIPTSSSGSGTATFVGGAINYFVTCTYPAGLKIGDTLLVKVDYSGQGGTAPSPVAPTVFDSNGATYTLIGRTSDTTNAATVKLSGVYARVLNGTEGALAAVCGPSSAGYTVTLAYECFRIAGPVQIDVASTPLPSRTTGTTLSFASVTTTGPDRLVVLLGMAGAPTTGIDTATVTGATYVEGVRSGTTLAGRTWSFVQAAAGATGTKTSSTLASSGSALDQYVLAFKLSSITVNLDGVEASPAVGALSAIYAISVAPSGVTAAPTAGTVTVSGGARQTMTDVSASPAAGSISATGGARAALSGVAAIPTVGNLGVTLRILITPTGVSASPAAGNLVAKGGARMTLTGVAGSTAVGSIVATGSARVSIDGVAAAIAIGRLVVEGAFDSQLLLNPAMAGQYLIEITAYQATGSSGGLATISEIPVGALPRGAAAGGGQITLRYADVDWVGDPSDALHPNVQYDGRVELPLHAERSAPLYPDETRRVQRQFGAIEFINSDGALDDIVRNFGVDGRSVRVLFGPYMGPYADFALIASMVAVGWQTGEDIVRLELRDLSNILAQPLQTNLYAGTGGIEGTTDIAGKPKPLFFGECDNVTPTPIDPLNLIYQAHDGAMQSIDAVYDRAGLLTLDTSVGTSGNCANYAALLAATVGASKYATCLSEGLFKLGSSPAGIITIAGKGDKVGGVYSNAIDVIALRLIKTRGGVDGASVNESSFTTAAALGGPIGLFVSSNETPSGAELVDRVMASIAGWWGSTREGQIEAGRIPTPETSAIDYCLDEYDILSIQPEAVPLVRWRHRVSYGHNWTVQTGDLDVTVTDSRRQFLNQSDRFATASDGTLLTRHLSAVDAPAVQTLLVNESDADTIAQYLQGLFGMERGIYRIVVKRIGYLMRHGTILNITYPRFGLNNGKRFVVIGIGEDAGSEEIELRVWG